MTQEHKEIILRQGISNLDTSELKPISGSFFRIAHISDTHLGRKEYRENEELLEVETYYRFLNAIWQALKLNADIILHTGDIVDSDIRNDINRYSKLREQIESILDPSTTCCYIPGNHDSSLTKNYLREIFNKGNLVNLDAFEHPVSFVDGQIQIVGRGYVNNPSWDEFNWTKPDPSNKIVTIGAFHQSFKELSQSFSANCSYSDLVPGGDSLRDWYDILALGHMHTDRIEEKNGVFVVDGGSAAGINVETPSLGLITLTPGVSYYERYHLTTQNTVENGA